MDKMKKSLMIIAMVAIVAIAGSLVYYYVFFRPGIEKAEIKEEALRKENLEECLKEAEDYKKTALESFLEISPSDAQTDKILEFLQEEYQNRVDACAMLYGE